MNEPNSKDIWKRLFNLLFNNREPDDELPNIWAQFKKENLHRSDFRTALKSLKYHLNEEARKKLYDTSSEWSADDVRLLVKECSQQYQIANDVIETCGEASIVTALNKCPLLDKDFWRLLFTVMRDREVEEVSKEKRIPILEGGQTRLMSMTEIEQKFISENPDLLTTQRSVPDQMIHEDLIDAHFNTESVRESLKRSYDKRFSEAKKMIAEENPKLTDEEVERQAAAQAKKETKESREVEQLKHRVAMMAEDEVQKSILRAMKEFGIPVFVFRGVNTNNDIGRFLPGFGMKMSKLKAFKSGDSKSTLECEHDISAIALPPSGPLVSFVQVTNIHSD